MMRGQRPEYQNENMKEQNNREKIEIREQIDYINENLEIYKKRLQKMRETLPPEISDEELYRQAHNEGKLRNLVQFKPDNTCTSIINYFKYKEDKIKKQEPIINPITKQPIWCLKGKTLLDFITEESSKIIMLLLREGHINEEDIYGIKFNIDKIISILSNKDFVRMNLTYNNKLPIIITQKIIKEYIDYNKRKLGISEEEYINKYMIDFIELDTEKLYKFIIETQNIHNYDIEKVKNILEMTEKLYREDPINNPPYECQFSDPESGIVFNKDFLKYCKDENSLAGKRFELMNANLQNEDLRTRSFIKTNLEVAFGKLYQVVI